MIIILQFQIPTPVKDEIEKEIGQRWGILTWIHQFLQENNKKWEQDRVKRLKEESRELTEWDRMCRQEKIQRLKQTRRN